MNLNELAGRVIKVSLAKRALSTLPAGMDRTASPSLSLASSRPQHAHETLSHTVWNTEEYQKTYGSVDTSRGETAVMTNGDGDGDGDD